MKCSKEQPNRQQKKCSWNSLVKPGSGCCCASLHSCSWKPSWLCLQAFMAVVVSPCKLSSFVVFQAFPWLFDFMQACHGQLMQAIMAVLNKPPMALWILHLLIDGFGYPGHLQVLGPNAKGSNGCHFRRSEKTSGWGA